MVILDRVYRLLLCATAVVTDTPRAMAIAVVESCVVSSKKVAS